MLKTLNNNLSRKVVNYALYGKHRFCAYFLYNHYYATTYDYNSFERLYDAVIKLYGDNFYDVIENDNSIDWCVKYFFRQMKGGLL